MNASIKESEIQRAISRLTPNKTPGPTNGLTPEFYKKCCKVLVKRLKKIFDNCIRDKVTPKTWQEAVVVLISKLDKELQDSSAYRPTSLLNLDYKIFAEILAQCLKQFVGNYG